MQSTILLYCNFNKWIVSMEAIWNMDKEIKKRIAVSISDAVEIVLGVGIVLLISFILGILGDMTFTLLAKTTVVIAVAIFVMSLLLRSIVWNLSDKRDKTVMDKINSIISVLKNFLYLFLLSRILWMFTCDYWHSYIVFIGSLL